MNRGWKQVWEDIRNTLREPEAAETTADGSTELAIGDRSPSVDFEQKDLEAWIPATEEEGETRGQGDDETETQEGIRPVPITTRVRQWVPTMLGVGVMLLVAYFVLRGRFTEARLQPPAPDVVATYDGGQITIEDVRQHLALLVPDENMQRQLQTVEGYYLLIEEMITDELVRRWAAERKADRDENFQHVMKHITEEINLDELHAQMHQRQMDVTEGKIQTYYDANRQQFGDQTLTQARDQIRTTLQAQGEDQFVQEYTDRLRENATITRDFALLEVPGPEERELKAYYEAKREQYVIPAQAMVDEIRVPTGQDEAAAQERANKALARLRSGENLVAVISEFSDTPFTEQGVSIRKGQRDPAYDEVVFALDEGQISDVFPAGDAFYVVRLRASEPEYQQSLDQVREQVRQAVLGGKETAWFTEYADRTLFTIHGERYTVGEFWQEYLELPPTFLVDYQGTEGRKALAERLIERMLLVEDSYDQLLSAENEEEIEELRLDVLAQMMHQEEVDDKIEVTDEELEAYYGENEARMVGPPQARIRYIMIRLGQTDDERQKAWDKADEAFKKLSPGLLKEGADFADVASQYSEDEASASKGGEMEGWIGEGPDILAELTDHPFHQRVLSLRVGETSHPIEWNGAIYIVQVLERKVPRPLTFEEVKEFLREELRSIKHDDLTRQLSQELLEAADVTIYDRTLQALFEEQRQAGQP